MRFLPLSSVTRPEWNALALLWLSGAGTRITLMAVPPVLPLLAADLDMSGTEIGFLNGLPIVLFAVAALPGSRIIASLGARATLTLGLLVAALAGALRAESRSTAFLYAMTALMGAGIAIAQPALPTLVRAWLPARIALGTATASNGMVLGPVAPVALSLPLLLPLAGGWRGVLALWSVPLALIAAALLLAPGAPRPAASMPRAPMRANNALVWRLGLVFAGTNSVYFCVNAFAPGLLAAQDRADLISPTLTSFHLGQLPATLVAGFFARRVETSVWPYVATGLIIEAMLLALVSHAGAWTIFWAACLGFCNCTSLVFGLALPALLAAPADVPRLAAGMFTVSYSCAMAVAVAGGAAWDFAGDARWAFLPVAASVLPMILLAPAIRGRQ